MSKYYNPPRRTNFDPNSTAPFRLSRSKIEQFTNCKKCFYIDQRLGVAQPPGYPFSLNSAVDGLLKKEFDIHRADKTPHPMMEAYGLDAVPFQHEQIDRWREVDFGRGGIHYFHEETGFDVGGAIDDVWVNPAGELIIVDYKATAKNGEVSLDADWQDGYKRQMEIYQWLFLKNDFKVSPVGYFVYANGKMDKKAFDGKLEFDIKLIPYEGKTDWIEAALVEIKKTLMSDEMPESSPECDYCVYRNWVIKVMQPFLRKEKKAKKMELPKKPKEGLGF
ncbi:MAG: hypothetical protein COU10_02875 [Candidatus Harrisonbacteria bacterium CG10_big_fil_rev_8_21_14_0_10_45_28]|uniref:PD-(D/E)XK endonuclease-like domain-containing protein n=1 Tax=Candidatus Harrisonbacteria bacterium CG10_big_fil_rev_8_21_14_0_10_45_28 TaxID=1974586 RepID=A0A2H0UMZ9_9BACT|nr:MAG: hypothetical protein COU10_02875 [Candidatus Harrisonbacteria bacterium CG10_big_fil_rev_8_21_14_0_10_45_28]